jgi:hypothetical protein
VEDDLDVDPAAQRAKDASVDLGADGEHQRRGQRSLIRVEQPVPGEKAVGVDRANNTGGLEEQRDDVA